AKVRKRARRCVRMRPPTDIGASAGPARLPRLLRSFRVRDGTPPPASVHPGRPAPPAKVSSRPRRSQEFSRARSRGFPDVAERRSSYAYLRRNVRDDRFIEERAAAGVSPRPPGRPEIHLKRGLILVIEDEDLVREPLVRFLRDRGHDVVEADSCGEGERLFLARRPDLTLTDYNLPDGDALEMLPRLRAADRHALVVVVTAHACVELAVRA